jgi:hypothetical protein
MEIVDNAFILLVPGAIDAELNDALFWWSLGVSLIIAFAVALPLNYWLIHVGRATPSLTPTTPIDAPRSGGRPS